MLNNLKVYGVDDYSLNWLKSFLTGRKQFVSLAGNDSDMADMKRRVPQGSIPGPLLFMVFINGLPLQLMCADDTTISSCADCKNIAMLQDPLNRSVLEVVDWANANKPLNQKKTKVLLAKENGFLVRWIMYQ